MAKVLEASELMLGAMPVVAGANTVAVRAAKTLNASLELRSLIEKVLAEAEIKRQLQRKLDGKEAPLAALGEKEAVWAVERVAMQTQLRALEDQRATLSNELQCQWWWMIPVVAAVGTVITVVMLLQEGM